MHRRCTQVAARPVALSQRIVTGEGVIGIVQKRLKLANGLVPPPLLLIEPAQKIPGVGPIKAALENLLTEVDSIVETTLGLKGLSLFERPCDLAGCNAFTRGGCHPSSHACRSHCRTRAPTKIARATHITHDARITSA